MLVDTFAMAYTPVKTVTYTADANGLTHCSGCPGYTIFGSSQAAHTAWHQANGVDPVIITPPPPAKNQVTNLKAVATAQGEVTVTWTLPSPPPATLTVGRDGVEATGGGLNWSGGYPGTTTKVVFDKLATATKYTFTVTPVGGIAQSVSATTLAGAVVTPPPVTTPPGQDANGFAAAQPQGASSGFKLDWGDDFLGSALDAKKWMWDQRADGGVTGWGTDEWYDKSAVTVANSLLTIAMTHQSGNGRALKSGTVSTGPSNSSAKYSFKPGMFMEIRSKVPPASDGNLWPAWWGISVKGWPPEQDWYEFGYGSGPMGDTHGLPVTTWHYTGSSGPTSKGGGSYGSGDLRGAFHVYGVYWSADGKTLTMYVDGKKFQTYDMSMAPNNQWQTPQVIIMSHQSQDANVKDGSVYQWDWIKCWVPA